MIIPKANILCCILPPDWFMLLVLYATVWIATQPRVQMFYMQQLPLVQLQLSKQTHKKAREPGAAVSKVKLKKKVLVNHDCMYMPLVMVSNHRVRKPLLLGIAMHKQIILCTWVYTTLMKRKLAVFFFLFYFLPRCVGNHMSQVMVLHTPT